MGTDQGMGKDKEYRGISCSLKMRTQRVAVISKSKSGRVDLQSS